MLKAREKVSPRDESLIGYPIPISSEIIYMQVTLKALYLYIYAFTYIKCVCVCVYMK